MINFQERKLLGQKAWIFLMFLNQIAVCLPEHCSFSTKYYFKKPNQKPQLSNFKALIGCTQWFMTQAISSTADRKELWRS